MREVVRVASPQALLANTFIMSLIYLRRKYNQIRQYSDSEVKEEWPCKCSNESWRRNSNLNRSQLIHITINLKQSTMTLRLGKIACGETEQRVGNSIKWKNIRSLIRPSSILIASKQDACGPLVKNACLCRSVIKFVSFGEYRIVWPCNEWVPLASHRFN